MQEESERVSDGSFGESKSAQLLPFPVVDVFTPSNKMQAVGQSVTIAPGIDIMPPARRGGNADRATSHSPHLKMQQSMNPNAYPDVEDLKQSDGKMLCVAGFPPTPLDDVPSELRDNVTALQSTVKVNHVLDQLAFANYRIASLQFSLSNLQSGATSVPEQMQVHACTLRDMGFDNADAVMNALLRANGDVETAVHILIGGQND